MPATTSSGLEWNRNPTASPTPTMIVSEITFVATSATVRPASTAERDIGSEWKAVDEALLEVLRQSQRGDEATERHRLGDDPGHQEARVVLKARRLDRAAEDVHEQQHEHDRLRREGQKQVGRPRYAEQTSLREHHRVGDRVA